jgi:hypothetical protein
MSTEVRRLAFSGSPIESASGIFGSRSAGQGRLVARAAFGVLFRLLALNAECVVRERPALRRWTEKPTNWGAKA